MIGDKSITPPIGGIIFLIGASNGSVTSNKNFLTLGKPLGTQLRITRAKINIIKIFVRMLTKLTIKILFIVEESFLDRRLRGFHRAKHRPLYRHPVLQQKKAN